MLCFIKANSPNIEPGFNIIFSFEFFENISTVPDIKIKIQLPISPSLNMTEFFLISISFSCFKRDNNCSLSVMLKS